MRLSKSYLKARFSQVALEMGWNAEGSAWSRVGERLVSTIGHVSLDHNSVYGWEVHQIANETGGIRVLRERCKASELDAWMSGVLFAKRA
jgi:hypothetical protein